MIVNATENGWDVIFQRSHALVAGALALQIKEELRPPNWVETLSAIIDHDDGQSDWNEVKHISETGRPLDFTMYDVDLKQAKRVVEEAMYKSKWITLLVSMHASSLYGKIEKKISGLADFLNDQKALQKELRSYFKLTISEAEKHYRFLRWCDECSLILCQRRLINDEQQLEVGVLLDHEPSFIQKKNDAFSVEPWCFAADSFEVKAEVYGLNKLKFRDTEEMRQCIESTKPKVIAWLFVK